MDADTTASYQLLNGLLLHIEKPGSRLTPIFSRHACAALLSKPLLQAAHLCSSNQQQQGALLDASDRLLNAVTKLVSRGSLTQQALALQILTACLHSCGLSSLLTGCVGWATQITEVLKQSGAATSDVAVQAAAAESSEAACRAAAVLFRRLRQHIDLPGVRREVTSIVPKLLPQLLAVLQANQSTIACQAAALQLLSAILQCVPAALRTAVKNMEQVLHQLVLTIATNTNSSTEPSYLAAQQQILGCAVSCMALLPAVPGDAASWSDMMRRLLVSSHDTLDYLLMGLESRPADVQYRAYLSAAGNQQQDDTAAADAWFRVIPWQQQQEEANNTTGRRHMLTARLLLGVCLGAVHQMLQQSFPVAVPLPGYSLSLLAARLLQFNAAASVAAGAVAASSTMYQELLVLQPQLQQAGWGLLQLVVAVAGHQLQLQGLLVRLVRQGLRTIQISGLAGLQQRPVAVRRCVYDTAADVLRAAGLAGVKGLAAEVIGCAVLELYGHIPAGARAAGLTVQGNKTATQRPAKRPKTSSGAALDQFDPAASAAAATGADDEITRFTAAATAEAQTAALQMLQQLLESGGQLLPAELRAQVDAVVLHLAQTAAAAALRLQQQPALCSSVCLKGLQSLQLAAYAALLASILVPCGTRPPFLGQAVLLFREGRSSSDPCLSALCSSAAVQVEALLHPRAVAMSSVKQYPGMETVPALTKPLMWSALEDAAGKPAAQAGATATVQDHMASADVLQQSQQHLLQPHAGAAPVVSDVAVAKQPVELLVQQQQQPLQDKMHPAQSSAAVPGTAASTAAPAVGPAQPQLLLTTYHPQPKQRQPALSSPQAQQPQPQTQAGADAARAPASLLQEAAAVRLNSAKPAPAGDIRPAGGVAAMVGELGLKLTSPAGLEAESSDSEGPLPEIDSGSASESAENA